MGGISPPAGEGKQWSPFHLGLLWGVIVTLTAVVSGTIGATVALIYPSSGNLSALKWQFSLEASPNLKEKASEADLPYRLSRPMNILVMGLDCVTTAQKGSPEFFAGRSDTILLLRFDPRYPSLRILSIPPGSRVEIPGVGFDKLNNVNAQGGPALTARTVSKTLNDVPIDRYVRMTPDALKELVDLVGGIEVFVPQPMSYVDRTQKLEIHLEPGWQTLNGDQAGQFARFRDGKDGDVGRVQRQQILLEALAKRLQNPGILPRLPQAVRLLQQYIDTNLTLEEMLALANLTQALNRDETKMVILPGRFSESYWTISPEGRDRVMRDYFALPLETVSTSLASPSHLRIAIQNASDDPELARRVASYLAEQDFQGAYPIGESPLRPQETEIIVQQGDLAAAENLRRVLGFGRVEASSTGDLDSDLTVRVGADAQQFFGGDSKLKNQLNNN